MKKNWIFFVLSPIFVWVLWLIVSLIFWTLSNLGVDMPLLMTIKTLINRILWMLALISIPLLIVGIVFLAKSQDNKLPSKEVIHYAREKSKKHMTRYLLWFLFVFVLQSLSSYIDWLNEASPDVIFSILWLVITLLTRRFVLWLAKISLSVVYEESHKISNLFPWFFKTIKYIVAYILSAIIILCWFILLIVPWIIRSFKLSLVPYIILQDWVWPIAAIKKSRKMTKWFVWDMFIINLLAGLINILWMLALLVWLLWTIPLYMIANAYIYKRILEINWWKPTIKTISSSSKPTSKTIVKKTIVKKKSPTTKKAVGKKPINKKAK